jgi:hypothetical protein
MDFGSNHLTESLDRITWPNQLIETFINVILSYFKVSINWPIFRRLTEKFDQLIRSSEIRSTDPLSNFDKVIFPYFQQSDFWCSDRHPPSLNQSAIILIC